MTHFGILCLGGAGHLNTMFPIAHELKRRGHQITIFSGLDAQLKTQAAGFYFYDIESPLEGEPDAQMQALSGLAGIRQTFQRFARKAKTRLQKASVIQERGVEMLLVDLSVFEGGTIADALDLPYVTICSILPLYEDPTIPPIPTTWQYRSEGWAALRNRAVYRFINWIAHPVWHVIARERKMRNLPKYQTANDIFSKLAIITRHIPEFEFPRQFPDHWHFTGPFHHSVERPIVEFSFEQLNHKPLIYASMGTVQNRFSFVFHTIAEACADLDAQLVISLGGGLEPEEFPNLPGNPIIVKYAPQLELLQKASLNITHAGLNTTLESLSYGVPMVAIPVTDDQPGVAARIAWTGTGEIITLSQLSVSKLRGAIERVLTEESYKQNAIRLQELIHQTGGVNRAADIIEQAASK
jgi:zeaxanthin glucosyltransferase